MIRYLFAVTAWTVLLVGGPVATPTVSHAQETAAPYPTPDWSEFPLLMSQFGELCTMCVAYLQCTPSESSVSTLDGPAASKLYYFQTKSFWGQIATIWDYFAKWFDPVTSEERPATIYAFAGSDSSLKPIETIAYLDKEKGIIQIDGTTIDRETSAWLDGSGTEIGACTRLSIPDSMALIAGGAPTSG